MKDIWSLEDVLVKEAPWIRKPEHHPKSELIISLAVKSVSGPENRCDCVWSMLSYLKEPCGISEPQLCCRAMFSFWELAVLYTLKYDLWGHAQCMLGRNAEYKPLIYKEICKAPLTSYWLDYHCTTDMFITSCIICASFMHPVYLWTGCTLRSMTWLCLAW